MPKTELTGKSSDLLQVVLPAAARGDLESVQRFLAADWRWILAIGPHNRTMLWEACYRGREETVEALIAQGGDVNAAGTYCTPLLVDLTPYCVALRAGRESLAARLADHGALNDIHSAAYLGDVAAVEAWLARDPGLVDAVVPAALRDPVDGRAVDGALTKALEKKLTAIEDELERCIDPDLSWARGVIASTSVRAWEREDARLGWGTAFRAHLRHLEDLIRNVAMGAGASPRKAARLRALGLRRRAWLDRWQRSVECDGYRPLHYAVAGKQAAVVELLIDRGAAVVRDGARLLDWSMDPDAEDILLTLLESGARLSEAVNGEWAADSRLAAIARRFGVEAHIDAPDGNFPILVDACRGNHNAPDDPERVRPLLAQGADIRIRDYKGKTALHRAAQAGFVKITRLLIESGADLEARDVSGETPLFDAVRAGRLAAVQVLVSAGASPEAANEKGLCPVDAAARGRRADAAKILDVLRCAAS